MKKIAESEAIKVLEKEKKYSIFEAKTLAETYAFEAFQDALNRGVDPWKIQESLNNLK